MRRSILVMGVAFCLALVISLLPRIDAVEAQTIRESGTELSNATASEQLQTLEPRFSVDELLERAEENAHAYGLEMIDGEPEWIWTTRDSEVSGFYGQGILNPMTPLFMVSFRGTGFWNGPGCIGC